MHSSTPESLFYGIYNHDLSTSDTYTPPTQGRRCAHARFVIDFHNSRTRLSLRSSLKATIRSRVWDEAARLHL
jgi:hypothetical protein